MEFKALIQTMRALNIYHDPVEGKPYAVRFIGSPYNCFVEGCLSIQVIAHNRGTVVSPHNIAAVIAKFGITEQVFFDALDSVEAEEELRILGHGPNQSQ